MSVTVTAPVVRVPAGPVEVPPLVTAIVSAGRAGNVPAMNAAAAGLRPVWVVPRGEESDYRQAGALRVEGVPGRALAHQRNHAVELARAAGGWCVQMDDDLGPAGVRQLDHATGRLRPVSLVHAVREIAASMAATGARLGGASTTANAYFSRRPLTAWGFVAGALCVVVPGPEAYDPALLLKSDWDMCCQHLAAYGLVARRDDLLPDWRRYSSRGGCARFRTPAVEAAAATLLLGRWPALLAPHPRRPNELRLRPRRIVA